MSKQVVLTVGGRRACQLLGGGGQWEPGKQAWLRTLLWVIWVLVTDTLHSCLTPSLLIFYRRLLVGRARWEEKQVAFIEESGNATPPHQNGSSRVWVTVTTRVSHTRAT